MKFKEGDKVKVVRLDPKLSDRTAKLYVNKTGKIIILENEWGLITVKFKDGLEIGFTQNELDFDYKSVNIKKVKKYLGVK